MMSKIEQLIASDIPETLPDLIRWFKENLNLQHVVYHATRFPNYSWEDPFLYLTYSSEWLDHYRKQKYLLIDPVVQTGMRSILPFDWNSIVSQSFPKGQYILDEGREFGVGRQGLTIPVRGPDGFSAIFTVTSNDSNHEWRLMLKEHLAEINLLGHYFHHLILDKYAPQLHHNISLSPRERECIAWSSEGKTVGDIAEILSIATVTVRAHLDSARNKLNAVNKTHAIIKALRHGIIS